MGCGASLDGDRVSRLSVMSNESPPAVKTKSTQSTKSTSSKRSTLSATLAKSRSASAKEHKAFQAGHRLRQKADELDAASCTSLTPAPEEQAVKATKSEKQVTMAAILEDDVAVYDY